MLHPLQMGTASIGGASTLTIDADDDRGGAHGTLTIVAGRTVTTNDNQLRLSAWDLDLAGSINAGSASLSIHGAKAEQTIGLGDTAKDMHVDANELSRITVGSGLEVQYSSSTIY